ncbi:Protein phosphatase 2C 2 [Lobosporangium transversale]|uniref:protein-serine/threonine phosphatase n=1 Tax=Lobosporangium transversale TaxID=64571 RepID=A0A1Y2GIY5_9FUNG|nr:phosphatase 2C-like domain-containing protein [Lobosporangium transversale]KAF9899630.1 Protein phosphatase 2C 2 [Lobosporangium transversale]ORZ12162.1 phosphatase 2C-like domain-containing protein [Lobosporangium transversale]|eukprot:XP_021880027.1 phosphatase 2C-like domain-containing protein [Lobosporangium transversale]
MGQTLSAPITEKHSTSGHDERLAYGASSMQGWRISMEDAHTTLLQLENAPKGTSFFAVYDGHGGPNVAMFSGEALHKKIVADYAFSKGDYKTAIKNGFLEMDRALRHDPEYGCDSSGCTAITATITDNNILYVGNAGDSRAVLGSNGTAIAMSNDHKPMNKAEAARIVAAGGFVQYNRVNGNLALSRALGDFEFKMNAMLGPEEQIVTANPAIREHKITDEDEFLVLACDGIWDCMSSQDVITFIRKGIADKIPLERICEMTMDHCLASDCDMAYVGCDNMTIIIVAFLNGRTVEEWYEHVSNRVAVRLGPENPSESRPNGDEDPDGTAGDGQLLPPPSKAESHPLYYMDNVDME